MESSRRDHLNGVAEHRSILKSNQNTYYTRFSFIPKTDRYSITKHGYFVFSVYRHIYKKYLSEVEIFF